MVVRIHTFPPLGRVSHAKSHIIAFSVLLEFADADAEKPWEICLWHSSGEQPWEETTLQLAPRTESLTFLQPESLSDKHASFSAALPVVSPLHFTFKYRSSPTQPWIWARDELGVEDGLITPNTNSLHPLTDNLSSVIRGLNPKLKVKSVTSQTPRTQLWSIEATVAPASDDVSSYGDVELGIPWGGFIR